MICKNTFEFLGFRFVKGKEYKSFPSRIRRRMSKDLINRNFTDKVETKTTKSATPKKEINNG